MWDMQSMAYSTDQHPATRFTPITTYILITISIIVFLYQRTLPDPPPTLFCFEGPSHTLQEFLCRYGVIPDNLLKGQAVYTLITAIFLHGNWLHLAGNMVLLWVFGDHLEELLGHVPYLLFFLTGGIMGSIVHVLLNRFSTVPSVGASGAIAGILGAYLIIWGFYAIRIPIGSYTLSVPTGMLIVIWAIQQFVTTYSLAAEAGNVSEIAYGAHVGGFVMGLLLGIAFRYLHSSRHRP